MSAVIVNTNNNMEYYVSAVIVNINNNMEWYFCALIVYITNNMEKNVGAYYATFPESVILVVLLVYGCIIPQQIM